MISLIRAPSKLSITSFLFWYRFLTIGYAALLFLAGQGDISILLLILLIVYNALIFRYRLVILDKLRKHPHLILIDLLLVAFAEIDGGAYANPYVLYTFSPLFIGGFFFGYRGALILGGAENVLIIIADYLNGYNLLYFNQFGEHILTYILLYFLIPIVFGKIKIVQTELIKSQFFCKFIPQDQSLD